MLLQWGLIYKNVEIEVAILGTYPSVIRSLIQPGTSESVKSRVWPHYAILIPIHPVFNHHQEKVYNDIYLTILLTDITYRYRAVSYIFV